MTFALDPEQVETQVLHNLVDFSGKDVLEIGCGDGRLTGRFADRAASVLAFDPKEDEIAAAQRAMPPGLQANVTFQVTDMADVQLPDAAFDVVIFSWSL